MGKQKYIDTFPDLSLNRMSNMIGVYTNSKAARGSGLILKLASFLSPNWSTRDGPPSKSHCGHMAAVDMFACVSERRTG